MIDQKLAIITIHDVNPSDSEKILKTSDELNKLKIKYNLSIIPFYNKEHNLKDHPDFCDQISSLLQSGNVELTLHGLYHQLNGRIEDFDTESKEQEKQEIQQGLDILTAVSKLPKPSMFIPPAWHLSRQCIEALKELGCCETETEAKKKVPEALDIVAKRLGNTRTVCKKYYVHPVIVDMFISKKLEEFLQTGESKNDERLSEAENILMKILDAG